MAREQDMKQTHIIPSRAAMVTSLVQRPDVFNPILTLSGFL